jgi:hypothetical protein
MSDARRFGASSGRLACTVLRPAVLGVSTAIPLRHGPGIVRKETETPEHRRVVESESP